MNNSANHFNSEQLAQKIKEKKDLYDQMLEQNKEFEEVKTLFTEIRDLEKLMKEGEAKSIQSESDKSHGLLN